MTTTKFYPTSIKSMSQDLGTWDNGAATSDFDAVDDPANDSFYLELTAIVGGEVVNAFEGFQFNVTGVGTISRVRCNWRTRRADWGEFRVTLAATDTDTGGVHWGPSESWQRPYPLSTIFNYSTPWRETDANGVSWDTHHDNSEDFVVIVDHRYQESDDRLYYLELEVEHEAVPTINVTDPTGAQSTGTPTVKWTYSGAIAQSHYRVLVFDSANYPTGDPDTQAEIDDADWDSGKVASATAREVIVGSPLDHGGTYRAYLQCSAGDLDSAWDYSGFTTSYTKPTAPGAITAESFSTTTGVLSFSIAAAATGDRLEIHRSTDSGTSWELAFYSSALSGTMYDVRVPLGESGVRYRARSIDDTSGLVSDWTTDTTDTATTLTTDTWFLKAESDPTGSIALPVLSYSMEPQRPVVTIPNAAGGEPGVITGGNRGDMITVSVQYDLNAARVALQALLDLSESLVLQSPFGDSWWVRRVGGGDMAWVMVQPDSGETTDVRDYHLGSITFQEVRTPEVS